MKHIADKKLRGAYETIVELNERIEDLLAAELDTLVKIRKIFVSNARKFGYENSVGVTINQIREMEHILRNKGGAE